MMNCSENTKPRRKRHGHYWRDLAAGLLLGALIACAIGAAALGIAGTANAAPDTDYPVFTFPVEPENMSLGPCRITAYCACERCCGKWAKNRPNGIVYGAAGVELKAGVSCASPWPMGTVVEIEGLGEYTVQDRPAEWVIDKYGRNQFDIYFDSHEAACKFGLQYINVTIKEETA